MSTEGTQSSICGAPPSPPHPTNIASKHGQLVTEVCGRADHGLCCGRESLAWPLPGSGLGLGVEDDTVLVRNLLEQPVDAAVKEREREKYPRVRASWGVFEKKGEGANRSPTRGSRRERRQAEVRNRPLADCRFDWTAASRPVLQPRCDPHSRKPRARAIELVLAAGYRAAAQTDRPSCGRACGTRQ